VFYFSRFVDTNHQKLTIQRPRTMRQMSKTHKRDLVTNQNVSSRPFLGQIGKSFIQFHGETIWKGGFPHLETMAEIMEGVVKFK